MELIDKNTVVCDNCSKEVPATQQDTAPDHGWSFDPRRFGYYGGFDDHCFADEETNLEVIMCHDCVVSLIESFPAFAKHAARGGHPGNFDSGPCCKHCWTWEVYVNEEGRKVFITYLVDDDGSWEFSNIQVQ
jgi:hypothetical protein